jgi:hypothetical protein
LPTALLGHDGVLREMGAQAFHEELFGAPVSAGDGRTVRFVLYVPRFLKLVQQQNSGLLGNFLCDLQIAVYGGGV